MFLCDDKRPKEFTLVPGQVDTTTKVLEPAVYNLVIRGNGPMQPPTVIFEKTDKYNKGMLIKGGVFSKARTVLNRFVQPEMYTARESMGMMHKLGVIFDGKPGTGKTFLAGQIAKEFAEDHNAVSIVATDHGMNYAQLVDSIREFDKDRLIVLVMDEFEKSRASSQSSMLSFLDGTDSRNNVVVIATINDLGDMPSYLKNRPGRFESILDFKSDDPLVLKSIVTQCIPQEYKSDFDVDELVKEFRNKANANKFGINNSNDDFTVDRLRVVIRDLVADVIKEKDEPQKALGKAAVISATEKLDPKLSEKTGHESFMEAIAECDEEAVEIYYDEIEEVSFN